MNITIQPLTDQEKTKIHSVHRGRIILLVFVLLPLLAALIYIFLQFLKGINQLSFDFVTIFFLSIFALVIYYIPNYFFPLYRDSFRNLFATNKKVIETKILNINSRWTGKSVYFTVETEFMTINTFKHTILMPGIPFLELRAGMEIKIHCIDNNKLDILQITT